MPEHARSCRLRAGRVSELGRIYLISSNVQARDPVFKRWPLGRLVVREFRRAEEQGLVQSLAWVVMSDHFHWLFVLKRGSLPLLMKQVKARSAISINKVYPRERFCWQPGFHDMAIRREDEVLRFARYVVANPLRAGLVARIGDYPLWDAAWL